MTKVLGIEVLLFLTLINWMVGTGDTLPALHDRTKRHLNWAGFMLKSSNTNLPDITITKYRPHSNTHTVDEAQNYLAFTLYQGDTGIFHFVHESSANTSRRNCSPRTWHAGAYHYIYGRCPETTSNLIASGFCYNKTQKSLVFHSGTFDIGSKNYVSSAYYLNDDRTEHPNETQYLVNCYNTGRIQI